MADKPLVLITHPLPDDWVKPLNKLFTVIVGPDNETGISPSLAWSFSEVEAVFSLLSDKLTIDILRQMPNLKVIANMAAGTDNIDLAYCQSHKIKVGKTPGVLTNSTADLTFALMLAVMRNVSEAAKAARLGEWKMWHPAKWLGKDLAGTTLGIYGMGEIGKAVARRALGFDMKVIYHNRNEYQKGSLGIQASYVNFEELVAQSDVLTIHVPLNEDTRYKFNAKVLHKMKSQAILINMGRGSIVRMEDLVTALQEGWIRGAGLDVTDPEPLPPTHPLYKLSNCLILPHIGSATEETRSRMAEMAIENIQAGMAGKPLPFPA